MKKTVHISLDAVGLEPLWLEAKDDVLGRIIGYGVAMWKNASWNSRMVDVRRARDIRHFHAFPRPAKRSCQRRFIRRVQWHA